MPRAVAIAASSSASVLEVDAVDAARGLGGLDRVREQGLAAQVAEVLAPDALALEAGDEVDDDARHG